MTGDLTSIFAIVVFWGFIASCVFLGVWKQKKLETLRHETARLLIEKNPAIDSAVLAQLLNSRPRPNVQDPKMMKVFGIIVIAVGLGLGLMGLWFVLAVGESNALGLGGPAALIIVIGAGFIFASRFIPRSSAKVTEMENSSEISKNVSEL